MLRYIALLQRVDIVIKHGKRSDRSRFRVQGSGFKVWFRVRGSRCGSGFRAERDGRNPEPHLEPRTLNRTWNPNLEPP